MRTSLADRPGASLADPYANAFNSAPNGKGWSTDFRDQGPWVWERKYQLDSLTSYLDLALRLHAATGLTSHLDQEFHAASRSVVGIIDHERRHDPRSYRMLRRNASPLDSLSNEGYGAPVGFTGLSWSGFRPSGDACELGYLIPANAHAAVVLRRLSELSDEAYPDSGTKENAATLAEDIEAALRTWAIIGATGESVLAYEVDGLGAYVLMDDASVTSLLSLPYLGWCAADAPLYLRTRAHVLSAANPWFVAGREASGMGSSRTRAGYVWPLAIAIEALTSIHEDDVHVALELLESTDAGAGVMHEAFDANRPARFHPDLVLLG